MTLLELNDIVLQQGDFSLQIPELKLESRARYLLKGDNGAEKCTAVSAGLAGLTAFKSTFVSHGDDPGTILERSSGFMSNKDFIWAI